MSFYLSFIRWSDVEKDSGWYPLPPSVLRKLFESGYLGLDLVPGSWDGFRISGVFVRGVLSS
jgi:hypothetical protein